MERIPSNMSLHLRYRTWIAEMNFDINLLRIFDDYINELSHKTETPEMGEGIHNFENLFIAARKEMDELRHEMHLLKMKLAATAREGIPLDYKSYQADHHAALKKRYSTFRKSFDVLKNDFSEFEAKWLD